MSDSTSSKKNVKIPEHPSGNLLLRTLAMPGDTNPAGDIFGGWIMSQIDISGAILAREIANGRVVTVAVDGMSFLKPVNVGDVVCCYGDCVHLGHTSLKIKIEIWVKKFIVGPGDDHTSRHLVTEATVTYVAVDSNGRPRPLPDNAGWIAKYGIDAASVGLSKVGQYLDDPRAPDAQKD
ncbi:MAG: acyl-CoA thioester hydrolase YciA [Succinivibrio sp.]|nr:acyl-CoA thioester hydrolase YciA [Succinivibrio sp.]